jgi:hypothetical protein
LCLGSKPTQEVFYSAPVCLNDHWPIAALIQRSGENVNQVRNRYPVQLIPGSDGKHASLLED